MKVGWRVEGRHDCLIFAFLSETGGAVLDELLPRGVDSLYHLLDRVIRDPILPVLAQDLWDGAEDRIGRLQADHGIALMLARLARQASEMRETEGPLARERLSPANLRRAKEFLRAHVGSDPSLHEIAATTGLSQYHFLRGFKTATGKAPLEWLRDIRIETACDLLETEMPIAHVALEVGLKRQSHFGTVFRKVTGQSPAAWRSSLSA